MFACNNVTTTRLAIIVVAAGLVFGGPTVTIAQDITQSQTSEKLLACGEIADATERMDCFDSVVESLDENSAGIDASDDPSSNAIAAPATATVAPATTAPATAAATAALAPSAATEVDDFGLENQKATEAKRKEKDATKKDEVESVHATIVTSTESGLNHFVVVLDNGQAWEETDGSRRIGLPKVGMPVEVYKGGFGGGYRMKIGNDNRVASVRRLR